jgi:hypothetical protein
MVEGLGEGGAAVQARLGMRGMPGRPGGGGGCLRGLAAAPPAGRHCLGRAAAGALARAGAAMWRCPLFRAMAAHPLVVVLRQPILQPRWPAGGGAPAAAGAHAPRDRVGDLHALPFGRGRVGHVRRLIGCSVFVDAAPGTH